MHLMFYLVGHRILENYRYDLAILSEQKWTFESVKAAPID